MTVSRHDARRFSFQHQISPSDAKRFLERQRRRDSAVLRRLPPACTWRRAIQQLSIVLA